MPNNESVNQLPSELKESVKSASEAEIMSLHNDLNAPYVNKFYICTMKNSMVKLGHGVEYTPEPNGSRYIGSITGSIQDMANLHNLLGKLLQAFQAEQQRMIQAAQGKINPEYLKKLEGLKNPVDLDPTKNKIEDEKK